MDRIAPIEWKHLVYFWEKVQKQDGGCWLWTAATNRDGYGEFAHVGKHWGAHRFSFLLANGDLPDGVEIDHLCRVRNCVNPAHLQAVNHKLNVHRGILGNKTHCPHGHEYTPENTRVVHLSSRGGRTTRACRTCDRARARKRNAERPKKSTTRTRNLVHGTTTGYAYGCRCDECKRASTTAASEYRARTGGREVPYNLHGTSNAYTNYGCRCDLCKQTARDKWQRDKAAKKESA